MQSVYQWRYKLNQTIEKIAKENIKTHPSKNLEEDFVVESIQGIKKHLTDIEKTITIAAPDWPIEQIDQIDLAILIVSVYELLYRKDIPPKVAIDEAVELGKEFGGENSASFINGVLGTIFRASDRYEGEKSEIIKTKVKDREKRVANRKKENRKKAKRKTIIEEDDRVTEKDRD
jgi:transcription antitermination protein NusB